MSKTDVYGAVKELESIAHFAGNKAIEECYVKVYLINDNPSNVRREIEKEFNYHTEWEGQSHQCGTITVYVPKKECTNLLLEKFKKYDVLLGATWSNDMPKQYPVVN